MKKTKKLLSVLMATIICISSFAVCNLSAYAAGWVDKVQEIEVNETITDSLNASKKIDNIGYFQVYKFIISEKGTIRLRVESNDVNLGYGYYSLGINSYYIYRIYSAKNISDDSYIWNSKNCIINDHVSAYDYYFSEYDINLEAGEYYFLVRTSEDCYLNKDYSFTLNYKPTFSNAKISSVSSRKKALKTSWNKCSNVSGYQLQYGINKNMKSAKTINLSSSSSSKTIKSLKSKKNYYVRIRTYKTVNINGSNKTYYGKWSPKKSVKTK